MRRSPLRATRRRRTILLAIQAGLSTVPAIARRTGIGLCAVNYHLRRLIADGSIAYPAYGQIRPARPTAEIQVNGRPAILEWLDDERSI